MTISACQYKAVTTYIDACCYSLSKEAFKAFLSSDVILYHNTNEGEFEVNESGIDAVSDLFEKYIFSNTSGMSVKSIQFEAIGTGVILNLLVEENKTEGGVLKRFLFEEKTTFGFNADKISSLKMVVKRSLPKPS